MTTAARVILPVANNRAYGPGPEPDGYRDELKQGVTLGELLALVEDAIAEHGEDALVVTRDNGNRYGANYGFIYREDQLLAVGQCEYCEEKDCDGTCED